MAGEAYDDGEEAEMYGRSAINGSSPFFPPAATAGKKPRFLDESREHAFDADEGVLDEELDEAEVPVMQGLLANARSRGSIDAARSTIEDTEHGLVVGRGNATLLSSIACGYTA